MSACDAFLGKALAILITVRSYKSSSHVFEYLNHIRYEYYI